MVRVKERYLLVNILYPRDGPAELSTDGTPVPDFVDVRHATHSDLTPQLLLRAIKAEAAALFGDCGAGGVERTLTVKYFNRTTSTFILRITREHVRYVWAALTFLRAVPVRNGAPCTFRVARVSGTIRKVEEEAIRQARALILATKEHMAGNTASALALLARARHDSDRSAKKDVLGGIVSDEEGGDDEDDDEDDAEDPDSDSGHDDADDAEDVDMGAV